MPETREEYELVPLSPLRKLERRLERLEQFGTTQEMSRELLDVVRANQQVVNDIIKINSEMINKVSELSGAVADLTKKINDFISRIEVEEAPAVAPERAAREIEEKITSRLDKLEKRLNALVLATLPRKQTPQ